MLVGMQGRGFSGQIGPIRLAVRTSRCGRDNPGSNPGSDTFERGRVLFVSLVRGSWSGERSPTTHGQEEATRFARGLFLSMCFGRLFRLLIGLVEDGSEVSTEVRGHPRKVIELTCGVSKWGKPVDAGRNARPWVFGADRSDSSSG